MSFVETPNMSNRRDSTRFEDYSRSRPRNFPAEFDDYSKRPRAAYEDRKGRPRDGDYDQQRYTRESREFPRPDYEDRRQNRTDRQENSFPGPARERGAPQDGDNPKPSKILGVFGLSTRTEERHLYDIMSAYGPLDDVQMVYDTLTGRSRGFAFVYFQNIEDARAARAACARGLELHDRVLRVDYSLTPGPHQPTPGIYMGKDKRRPNYGDKGGRYGYSDRRPAPIFARSRSRSPPSRRRVDAGAPEPPYHRRPRMRSGSRSRSPPPVYNRERREHGPIEQNGFRPRVEPSRPHSTADRFGHGNAGRFPEMRPPRMG